MALMEIQLKPKEQITKIPKTSVSRSVKNILELTEEEVKFESEALKYSVVEYPRITPSRGTLGFLFKSFIHDSSSRNQIIVQFLEESTDPFVQKILIYYNTLDENSKNRVDIFDWLCRFHKVSIRNIYRAVKEAFEEYNKFFLEATIEEKKLELVGIVSQFAKNERNFKDRELQAEITGLKSKAPLINLEDKSTNVSNNAIFSEKFANRTRRYEELVENKPLELEAGDGSIVDGQIVEDEK